MAGAGVVPGNPGAQTPPQAPWVPPADPFSDLPRATLSLGSGAWTRDHQGCSAAATKPGRRPGCLCPPLPPASLEPCLSAAGPASAPGSWRRCPLRLHVRGVSPSAPDLGLSSSPPCPSPYWPVTNRSVDPGLRLLIFLFNGPPPTAATPCPGHHPTSTAAPPSSPSARPGPPPPSFPSPTMGPGFYPQPLGPLASFAPGRRRVAHKKGRKDEA